MGATGYLSWRSASAADAEWMFGRSRTRLAPVLTEASSWMSDRGPARIRGSFAPGQVVELRGFLSASLVADPPLDAAGMEGAMPEIGIQSAADTSTVTPRQGETEYLLPRDCCCRVLGTVPDRPYRTEDGYRCVRAAVRL